MRGGSNPWELRRWCLSCSVAGAEVGSRGLMRDDMISGVCFPLNEVLRKELLSLVSVGVPRNPIVGGVTLLYISMDCLYRRIEQDGDVKKPVDPGDFRVFDRMIASLCSYTKSCKIGEIIKKMWSFSLRLEKVGSRRNPSVIGVDPLFLSL